LLLREFSAGDEPAVHEYAADPVVSQFMDWGPNSPEITMQHIQKRLAEQQVWPRDEVTLAIELREEGKLIGGFRFDILDRQNGLADFGFVINRRYWNRGYATEATRAVLNRTFGALKLHRIIATCDTRNIGSARVMEKAGMRREAHFQKDVFQKGAWRDSYLYATLNPSPEATPAP
jgi:RimJ/RimL family protein N-acetyltransferase